jgi:hypothetical protein
MLKALSTLDQYMPFYQASHKTVECLTLWPPLLFPYWMETEFSDEMVEYLESGHPFTQEMVDEIEAVKISKET